LAEKWHKREGAPYEMYNPIVAIEVAAANATELPKLGRPKMKLRVHASHTSERKDLERSKERRVQVRDIPVRMGDFHSVLTLAKNLCPGIPPSREKAYIIREFEVIENVLCRGGYKCLTSRFYRFVCSHVPAEVHCTNDDNL